MKPVAKEYPFIDIAKFVFSIMVVGIHTNAFQNITINHTNLFEIINLYVFDFAIPFFFLSSGYFLGHKILQSD